MSFFAQVAGICDPRPATDDWLANRDVPLRGRETDASLRCRRCRCAPGQALSVNDSVFDRFRQRVLEDAGLQQALLPIADPADFIERVLVLGREQGFEFPADEVRTALANGRRSWLERSMPDADHGGVDWPDTVRVRDLAGWAPIRLYWKQGVAWLDWCRLGEDPPSEPFFDHSVEHCLRQPFNLAFRRQSPIERLVELDALHGGPCVGGFIFHMSRCGSTLAAQLLAALPRQVVVSEASIVDALLRPELALYGIDESQRIAWLRAVLGALAGQRAESTRLFVKFDAWHTVHLPLIERAFPQIPWIFLYRDPLEVLVALGREGGGRLVPGVVPPHELGLDPGEVFRVPVEEYHARVLARICDAAIAAHGRGGGRLVNYAELPGVMWGRVAQDWRLTLTPAERECMQQRAGFDGKAPGQRFEDDAAAKQRAVTPAMREAAERWLYPRHELMQRLRDADLVQAGGSTT